MCGKNRFLTESICKTCNEKGYILCPECGHEYPAGYGKRCSDCYYLDLLDRKMKLSLGGLENQAMELLFRKYSEWLLCKYGSLKAAIVINKHFNFFQEVDQRWGEFPSYEMLLHFYGTEGLRRHRTPMNFLNETGIVHINHKKKEENSEERRIHQIVDEFEGTVQQAFSLAHYRNLLTESIKQDKLQIRTARLYLRAAANLLSQANTFPPSQNDVNRYLRKTPGQRASLTKFISYIETEWGNDLSLPAIRRKKHGAGSPRSEKKLIRLIKASVKNPLYEDREILVAALEYYHGVPAKAIKAFGEIEVIYKSDRCEIKLNNNSYWLPMPP